MRLTSMNFLRPNFSCMVALLVWIIFSLREHFTLIPKESCHDSTLRLEARISSRIIFSEEASPINACISTLLKKVKIVNCTEVKLINIGGKAITTPEAPNSQSLNVITTYEKNLFNNWTRYNWISISLPIINPWLISFFFFQIFRSPTSNEEINQLAYQCVPSFQIDFGRFCIYLCAKIVKMLFLLHKIYVFLKHLRK